MAVTLGAMRGLLFSFFFCNDTATTEIYTLSLHDALPIYRAAVAQPDRDRRLHGARAVRRDARRDRPGRRRLRPRRHAAPRDRRPAAVSAARRGAVPAAHARPGAAAPTGPCAARGAAAARPRLRRGRAAHGRGVRRGVGAVGRGAAAADGVGAPLGRGRSSPGSGVPTRFWSLYPAI